MVDCIPNRPLYFYQKDIIGMCKLKYMVSIFVFVSVCADMIDWLMLYCHVFYMMCLL